MNVKRICAVLCACLMIALCLCSCQKGGSGSVSLYDLKDAMASATDQFAEMKYASSADDGAAEVFTNISSEMAYGKVEDFFVYYAADGTGNADEIAVIEVKSKNDVALARAALEKHIQTRRALYATYDTTQLSKLDAYQVVSSGRVVGLIVADDAQAIATAFYNFMQK